MQLGAELERTYHTRDQIEVLLAEPRRLGPDYEPIHSLADDMLVGFKATGRGSAGTGLDDALSLLDGARSLGLVERIDWSFRALAFEDLLALPGYELHLTPEPETFTTACPPRFARLMARATRELRVAAEVHEDAFSVGVALESGLGEVRDWGWRVVLADVADSAPALDRFDEVRPDVVQVDLRLPGRRAPDGHPGLQRLLELAGDSGAEIMAVGVDSADALDAALNVGASMGRGMLYGLPGPLTDA
jgi:EAL domain-containing protein (putative c-di-GMP-specific phosphodiesterase class I)